MLLILLILSQAWDTLNLVVWEDTVSYMEKTYTMGEPYIWNGDAGDALVLQPKIIFNHYENVELQVNKTANMELWVKPTLQFPLDEWSKAKNSTGTGNFTQWWHLGNLFRIELAFRKKTSGVDTLKFLQIRIEE
jgi:hypothetical protein